MKWKKDRKEKKKSKKKSDQIIRIEELEEIIEKYGDDVDPETIVSMYVPHRQPKRLGAALLRMDKLHLVLLGMMLVVCILFIIAFSQEKMGNFTINLNRLELYRRGISISETGEFDDATAKLTANSVKDATNIQLRIFQKMWME